MRHGWCYTIYTKGNINLASYGQDHTDVGAKGVKPVLEPKDILGAKHTLTPS